MLFDPVFELPSRFSDVFFITVSSGNFVYASLGFRLVCGGAEGVFDGDGSVVLYLDVLS